MPLNPVQKNYMEAVRQIQEKIVRAQDTLNKAVIEMNAFAATPDKLPLTGPLDDERDNAPRLTGEEVVAMRNIAANMRDQIPEVQLAILIGKLVRSYAHVIGTGG